MRLSASEEVLATYSQPTGLNPCRSDTRIRATVTMPDDQIIYEWAMAYLDTEQHTPCRYDHHGQCQEHFMAFDEHRQEYVGCLQGKAIAAYKRIVVGSETGNL